MRYIIESARLNGWVVTIEDSAYSDCSDYANGLFAVGESLDDALERISARPIVTMEEQALIRCSLDEWAERIVTCHNQGMPRKISMIKLLRSITGCGLKEGKEAIERALHEAYRRDSDDYTHDEVASLGTILADAFKKC